MIKVIIADDEERICQLIEALVDWEALGMKIVGIAHNGLEACAMTAEKKPDILITDIRMPGCSGLDLIQKVRAAFSSLEIIIISGYAHFEYAQQAMKFGVGDYLLKPINKADLTATLEKLKKQIEIRRETENDKEERLLQSKKDEYHLQMNLLWQLLEQEHLMLSAQTLKERYYLKLKPGCYQAFYLKIDCGAEQAGDASISILMEKAGELIERSLRGKCSELVFGSRNDCCIGIMNYDRQRQEELRKLWKVFLSQLEMQKSLFRPVQVSLALGTASQEPELLGKSMQEAHTLIQEQIVRGTGRLLERIGAPSELPRSNVLERYLRKIADAIEVLSEDEAEEAVAILEREIHSIRDAHGYEIMDVIYSAADIFTVRMQIEDRQEALEQFHQKCERCGEVSQIFDCLQSFQNDYIKKTAAARENETVRPIRKAKQYIQNHFSDPITLEEVSGEVGLSPAYFSLLFKKTEGEGFAKYLINIRMEQAKILLRESNLSVAEICRKVGYNDLKHFTHLFEKAMGVKPVTYRKLYG